MDKIEKARQAHKVAGEANVFLRIARGLITIFIAGLGVMLSATLFSLAYPDYGGAGAIIGGVGGGIFFLLLGCGVSGLWSDLFPFDINAKPSFIPHSVYSAVGQHGDFQLIMTVHNVEPSVKVNNRFVNRPQLFVEVECGDNPLKQTCVNDHGSFEEQFKLDVKASDKSIVLYVKDQSLFGADTVGYVSIDIQKEILGMSDEAVKQRKDGFVIEGGSGYTVQQPVNDKAKLHLSFQMPDMDGQADKEAAVQQAQGQYKDKGYGAVDFLPAFAFNTTTTLNFEAAKDNEQKV